MYEGMGLIAIAAVLIGIDSGKAKTESERQDAMIQLGVWAAIILVCSLPFGGFVACLFVMAAGAVAYGIWKLCSGACRWAYSKRAAVWAALAKSRRLGRSEFTDATVLCIGFWALGGILKVLWAHL